LQTGGLLSGDISTTSKPFSSASARASSIPISPYLWLSSPIRKTVRAVISSLMRGPSLAGAFWSC
jgi:hypothetical protein